MADFEQDTQEAKPAAKPKAAKAAKGSPSPIAAFAVVIALVAIGLCVYLFMQVGTLNKQLAGELPAVNGLEEDGAGGHGASTSHASAGVTKEHAVTYDMGQITGNSLDGKIVAISIELELESTYDDSEWEVYQHQADNYEMQYQVWLEVQMGERQIDGTEWPEGEGPGSHAWVNDSGATTVVAHAAGPVELVPMEEPVKPARPMTNLETILTNDKNKLVGMVTGVINAFNGQDIITDNGFSDSILNTLQEHVTVQFGESQGKLTKVTIYNKFVK